MTTQDIARILYEAAMLLSERLEDALLPTEKRIAKAEKKLKRLKEKM